MDQSAIGLVTAIEAVSLTRGSGKIRLPMKAFYRFVASGVAPQPVERRGGEPLWSRTEIIEWSKGRVQPLLEGEARRMMNPSVQKDRDLEFPILKTASLDPTLATHRAVARVEKELGVMLEDVRLKRGHVEVQLRRSGSWGPQSSASVRKHSPFRLRRFSSEPGEANLRARVSALRNLEAELLFDLESCRVWWNNFFAWANEEFSIRVRDSLESAQLESEELIRCLDLESLECYSSVADFILEDRRRAASAQSDTPTRGGADFGYGWRHDESDDPYGYAGGSGTWAVSWIEATGEIYAWERRTDRIVLFGVVDSVLGLIIEWFSPIERRMKERNSLSLVMESLVMQRRAGFPAFRAAGLCDDLLF